MEIFAISFLVFGLACLALALGQFFGKGPLHASCRPKDGGEGCANREHCSLPCARRRRQSSVREGW